MPRRSKVKSLPKGVRKELDQKLVENGFQDYEDLSAWLAEQGHEISKSAVHRYGKGFEDRLDALRIATGQAQEIVSAVGDDEGAMGDALTMLVQERAFDVLTSMNMEEQEISFTALMNAIAQVQKSSVQQKKMMADMQQRAEQAADNAEEVAREEGLSDEAFERIREEILGIVD